ncbi:MAG: hypothetical protein H0U70_00610 [Tatlockia sp.]|nr:hypothetical protein [Tatlockia sp.]
MKVKIFGKEIVVEIKGEETAIPLLIVGPASLFKKKGLLPQELYEHFSVHFVDFFEAVETPSLIDYSKLTLDDFVNGIEQIRIQLKIDKMALFAHSANGVLALEYANKYTERVFFNILIGTMPIWGNFRKNLTMDFFQLNASKKRKNIDEISQSISPSTEISGSEKFIAQYKARKAQFFGEDNLINSTSEIDHLWDDVKLDMDLVNRYFTVIADYDLRSDQYNSIPTFVALGLYDASCPFYAWTDDFKKWVSTRKQPVPFEEIIKLYIFDSDHYPMSPLFNQNKSTVFVEKLLEYKESFLELNRKKPGLS